MNNFLVNKNGCIPLKDIRTKIGRKGCDIKIHCPDAADWHASIIVKPNGQVIVSTHGEVIGINDDTVVGKQILNEGDILSFAGAESFKFVKNNPVITIVDDADLGPIERMMMGNFSPD